MARPERKDIENLKSKRIKISAKDRERIFLRNKGKCVDCGLVCGGG